MSRDELDAEGSEIEKRDAIITRLYAALGERDLRITALRLERVALRDNIESWLYVDENPHPHEDAIKLLSLSAEYWAEKARQSTTTRGKR